MSLRSRPTIVRPLLEFFVGNWPREIEYRAMPALAKSLRRLLSDAALRRRLATQARKVIEERFDLQKNFGLLRNLLLEQVRDSSAAGRSAKVPAPMPLAFQTGNEAAGNPK